MKRKKRSKRERFLRFIRRIRLSCIRTRSGERKRGRVRREDLLMLRFENGYCEVFFASVVTAERCCGYNSLATILA